MVAPSPTGDAVLGRYRVLERVGSGAFGRVLKVIDPTTRDPRALKISTREEPMLLVEFEQLARLEHPSLPRVYEVGRTTHAIDDIAPGAPFFVADWIAGGRADARAWDDAQEVWSLLVDLAGALAVIHAAGLVHGDVAPGNVLLVDDGARAMLVDLGLSAVAGAGGARGTPAYMAPETLAGRVEPRSDLYGLGATVVRLVTGRPPFEAPTLGALVHAITSARSAPSLPSLPRPLADLVGRLVSADADRRPASALALLDELDQLAPVVAPNATRRARPKVSPPPAPSTWPHASRFVETLATALDGAPAVHVVVGVTGSGARDLVEAALQRWQLAAVARGAAAGSPITGTLDDLAARLSVEAGAATDGSRWLAAVAHACASAAPGPVVIELADDPRATTLLPILARQALRHAVVVLTERPPAATEGLDVHVVPLLDADDVHRLATSMLASEPPRAWSVALHRASEGLAQTALELLRSIADDEAPFAIDWTDRSTTGTTQTRVHQIRSLGDAARRLALAVAVHGGRVRTDAALASARDGTAGAPVGLADVLELERGGLARRTGSDITIERTTLAALTQVSSSGERAAIADAALAGGRSLGLEVTASLLSSASAGDHAELRCATAEALLARGRPDVARALATSAIGAPGVSARAGLIAARAAIALAAYADARSLARAAREAGADAVEADLLSARAAQRAGDLSAAEGTLAALHRGHPGHTEVAGAYARLLVTRSRFADAREVALSAGPLAGLRAEASGLAAFYLGELDEADRAFAALEVGASAAGDGASVGRALSLRGMVAQQRGQLGLASERYRDAARRLGDVGEIHAAAVAELNLGTALTERGRSSEALPRLTAAGRVFAALGVTTEQIAADLNRGNALLALGQAADARAAAEAALRRAESSPHLRAFALLVHGDALRRLGDTPAALREYRAALAIARERSDAHAQVSAYIALAEAGVPTDVDVAAMCASDDDRDRWTVARGRLALASPASGPADALADLARACAAVAARAAGSDRLERAFRAAAVAASLAERSGDRALARELAPLARAAHASLSAVTAPAFRAALDADPDLALFPAVPAAPPTRSREGAPELRRLLTLSRRLNSEDNVERILDEVIDTAIELTAAERGFLLLRQADGALAPVVSRNFAVSDLSPRASATDDTNRSVSLSIAERAAQTGEPVVTVDAGVDERFAVAASVAALRLRSVLVVPLRQRGTVTGCIYVDHRLRGGAFDDAAATVLGELADIAAIAIENARLASDLRRSTSEVDELNRRLSAELAERDAELLRVKADLPDRERLRHRYDAIVGKSPAMLRMLDVLDRASATSLPVVIVGESGTGKELVARALHDTGPRREAAFVAINCSAVPEPLLESELFGHVRGAFTGADRDRRGLFEVADGGTLFLDEVADTSAAMQAKLLRVLQDGMIRRVGDTRTRKVDVRVVAASQRSLAELAAAGTFREDLRYRLEVIAISVPPLRAREGDIPLLVEGLLARMCQGRATPRLTRAAVRALAQHRWPGNVRELENALARGLAMGGDVIDAGDLPEAIASGAVKPEPARPFTVGDDLRLKPALVATEQAYITAAMTRAKNNQTVAARLLGLSRFGLQKKLRRLAGDDSADAGDDE